jgi:hypothetical protein
MTRETAVGGSATPQGLGSLGGRNRNRSRVGNIGESRGHPDFEMVALPQTFEAMGPNSSLYFDCVDETDELCVDLYTPIATQIGIPIEMNIETQ